jgi:hypothetical protein
MNRLVCLPADWGPVQKAAVWLREHLDIPDYETIESQFEEYFNCKVIRDPPHDVVYGKIYAVFECEQDANWFILRWS